MAMAILALHVEGGDIPGLRMMRAQLGAMVMITTMVMQKKMGHQKRSALGMKWTRGVGVGQLGRGEGQAGGEGVSENLPFGYPLYLKTIG